MSEISWIRSGNYPIIKNLDSLRFFALRMLSKTHRRKGSLGSFRPARLGNAAKLVENLLLNLCYFLFGAGAGGQPLFGNAQHLGHSAK